MLQERHLDRLATRGGQAAIRKSRTGARSHARAFRTPCIQLASMPSRGEGCAGSVFGLGKPGRPQLSYEPPGAADVCRSRRARRVRRLHFQMLCRRMARSLRRELLSNEGRDPLRSIRSRAAPRRRWRSPQQVENPGSTSRPTVKKGRASHLILLLLACFDVGRFPITSKPNTRRI
jgi:hypothetical protein